MNNPHIQNNQANHDEANYVKITRWSVISNIILGSLYAFWAGSYLDSWLELDRKTSHSYNSVLLLLFMLNVFYNVFDSYKNAYIANKFIGRTILQSEYKLALMFDCNKFKMFCDLLMYVFEITIILMVPQFIPFTKANCYSYSEDLCENGRIGAFFGIILMIVYSIVFVFLLIMLCFICCNPTILRNVRFRRAASQAQRIPILNQLSLLKHLTLFDEECTICIQNGTESNDTNFVELPCGHNFHDSCVRQWINVGQNIGCPVCRAQIDPAVTRDLRGQTLQPRQEYTSPVPSAPPANTMLYTVTKNGQPVSLSSSQNTYGESIISPFPVPSAPPVPQAYYVNPNNPNNSKNQKGYQNV